MGSGGGMSRPRLLDLFSGAGGAAVGYHRAGFEVVGIDNCPMPRYPFEFHQADALEFVQAYGKDFDVIHASPPCQAYTSLRALTGKQYPDLVATTRAALIKSERPYIIENVPGAPLDHYITLCGVMFDLRVYRHRRFEVSAFLWQPEHPRHVTPANSSKGQRQRKAHYEAGGFVTVTGNVGSYCGPGMGIDWMTGAELSQAIPPAYTKYIGEQLMWHLEDAA